MSLNHAPSGPVFVPEYQISGVPFVTSSQPGELTSGSAPSPVRVSFPWVTQFVFVNNPSTASQNQIRWGFTQNGVASSSAMNSFVLNGGQSSGPIAVRCTDLWFNYHSGSSGAFSVVAGLTSVTTRSYAPPLTGSQGYAGVG